MVKSISNYDLDDNQSRSRSNSAASAQGRQSADVFYDLSTLHESSSSSQIPNTESSLSTLNKSISDCEIVSEQMQGREYRCVNMYIVAKRDPSYTKDAAIEVK